MSGSFDAGISALKMGIPVFVASPHFFTDPPEGNRQLIARGCRAWIPLPEPRRSLRTCVLTPKKNRSQSSSAYLSKQPVTSDPVLQRI